MLRHRSAASYLAIITGCIADTCKPSERLAYKRADRLHRPVLCDTSGRQQVQEWGHTEDGSPHVE